MEDVYRTSNKPITPQTKYWLGAGTIVFIALNGVVGFLEISTMFIEHGSDVFNQIITGHNWPRIFRMEIIGAITALLLNFFRIWD